METPPRTGRHDRRAGRDAGAAIYQSRPSMSATRYDQNLIGSWRGPRTVPSDHAASPASVKRGMRFSHSSTATVISRRARFEPTQRVSKLGSRENHSDWPFPVGSSSGCQ